MESELFLSHTHRDMRVLANVLGPCTTVLSAVMIEATYRTRAAVPLSGVEASCVRRKSHSQHLHLEITDYVNVTAYERGCAKFAHCCAILRRTACH